MAEIRIEKDEMWPYFFITESQGISTTMTVDVPKETLDELVALAAASYKLQAQLRLLYDAAAERRIHGEERLRLFEGSGQ